MWREDYYSAKSALERQNRDCAEIWPLLFMSTDKKLKAKVINSKFYRHAERIESIFLFWDIMRKESSNQYAALSAGDPLGQLTNLSQKHST